ncbi:acyl transferase domain-containing protein [Anaerobacterium chartisolvens]|uniref:Acyl transferase domain-containing protein n=1 Tax=Anaerobacterium chartisolvens TaxID=1297424 RepID=A0A369B6Y9_9FIRM|nr:type I polyketide synthase [Anaerobacterium chartisolvens]RCX16297.1 acyl transferase domain-containing protein [Anaerobacterium chartisolvens]
MAGIEEKYEKALKKATETIVKLDEEIRSLKKQHSIAVVGMACRFPGGANSPEEFWQLLSQGRDTVSEIPKSRFDINKYYSPDMDAPGKIYTRYGNFLNVAVDEFDASFFEIAPIEAESMDPQQRLLLEVSWEALENAGIFPANIRGSKTGVFIGSMGNEFQNLLLGTSKEITPYCATGVSPFAACGRLSYFYDFNGPSMSVDTACSSSLVALHYACESLRNKGCDMAMVGGVSLILIPQYYMALSRLKAISADGKSRSFSADADGYGRGEGCGFVIVKRLSDALRDGDNILAVIEGTEVLHDGKSNGLTAPNGLAQERLIKSALTKAGVSPKDVDYIEAHASATPLGDPIEINSLNTVYGGERIKPLLVGSVKSNIGHLEASAGMAGLIKLILSIQNEMLPPSINCGQLNAEIPWSNIPVEIVKSPTPWKRGTRTRIAGLSSLGLGGTITHVIVREPPQVDALPQAPGLEMILTLSAKTDNAIMDMARKYLRYIQSTSDNIADICYSSNISRCYFPVRASFVGSTREALARKLEAYISRSKNTAPIGLDNKSIVFLFTGQGSQYPGMGGELYRLFKVFKDSMDECDRLFSRHIDKSVIDLLYSEASNKETLEKTVYTQPVIFSLEYSLSKLWESFGVKPDYVMGHSIGSFAAACIAGVFTLSDAVYLVASRGSIVQSLPGNGMMGTILSNEETVASLIKESGLCDVSIAAVNNRDIVTISGAKDSVELILNKARENKIFTERLSISHAFHSPMINAVLGKFKEALDVVTFSKPKITIISDLTGKPAQPDEITTPQYWLRHISMPVRFYDAIRTIEAKGASIFIEVGAKALLCGFIQESVNKKDILCLPSLREAKSSWEQMLTSISSLYKNNIDINWNSLSEIYKNARKTALPNYPFQKKSFWFKSNTQTASEPTADKNVKGFNNLTARETEDVHMDITALEEQLKLLINEITGLEINEIKSDTDLFTLGFDSLMLVHLRNKIEKEYSVDVTLNKFMVDLRSVKMIAEYLKEKMPVKSMSEEACECIPLSNTIPAAVDSNLQSSGLQGIINQQLEIMHKQLDTLNRLNGVDTVANSGTSLTPAPAYQSSLDNHAKPVDKAQSASFTLRAMKFDDDPFTEEQKLFVDSLVKRYNERTKKSKEYSQKSRAVLSDWISSLNFRMSFKEMIYPLQALKSKGSRFWDVDENEYIDMAIGYGVNFFGNSPQFIIDAVQNQLKEGWELGPQTDLAGETAALICEMTGCERVAFANTGSEAVMTAVRIARTVTQRSKVVLFKGAFHGNSDIILGISMGNKTVPTSPGIMQGAVEDVVVLEYGAPETLEKIREIGHELAAVLVEPVQSRNPELQPKEFLHNVRAITQQMGSALIFDEIINGFRICQGGAQAHFGVKADIVTYGKVIGGGFPIGVIAGKAKYLDAVDGGWWQFGDGSYPAKEVTSFAGTFCKHPVSLAACRAVLLKMKEEGNALQERVNKLTSDTVNTLNNYFEDNDVPLRIKYFASQFRFDGYGGLDLRKLPIEIELFFYLMIHKGIYVWEKRICYFSTAHTQEDANKFIDAIKESVSELRSGGFEFTSKKKSTESRLIQSRLGDNYFSMSALQKGQFILDKMVKDNLAYHISGAMMVEGPLSLEKVSLVLGQLAKRHKLLSTGFELKDGKPVQKVHENVCFEPIYKKGNEEDLKKHIEEFITAFDLAKPPLARVLIVEISPVRFLFAVDFHHIISDGISMGIFIQEFISLYEDRYLQMPAKCYRDYIELEERYFMEGEFSSHKKFWKEKLSGELPTLMLPTDFPRPEKQSFSGNRICFSIPEEKTENMKAFGKSTGTSLFMIMFSLFDVLLNSISDCDDIIIGIPMSVRLEQGFENCFGLLTNSVAFRTYPSSEKRFTDLLTEVKSEMLNMFAYGGYPFSHMVEELKIKRIPGRNPVFDVMFSFENANDQILKIRDLTFTNYQYDLKHVTFDINFESMEKEGRIDVYFNYNTGLFKKETVSAFIKCFEKIVDLVLSDNNILISDIKSHIDSAYSIKKVNKLMNISKISFNC